MIAVASDVKSLLCTELAALDPHAIIHRTAYFNHSYMPDLVLDWPTKQRREVYLRFVTESRLLRQDVSRIGGSGPVLFDLSAAANSHPPPLPMEGELREVVSEHPRVMLIDTEASQHIRPNQSQNLVERMVVGNLIRAGRGLLNENLVDEAKEAARAGFEGAVSADPDIVRSAVAVARDILTPDLERRVERTLQLLWWAGGGAAEDFPMSLPDDMELDPEDTRDFLRSIFSDGAPISDLAFWRRLADRVDFEMLVSVGTIVASTNLGLLMSALAPKLLLSHVALDRRPRPLPPFDALSWTIEDQFIVLNGPDWLCRFTPHGNRFSQRREEGHTVPLDVASARTDGLLVEEAEIEEATRRVQLTRKVTSVQVRSDKSLVALAEGFSGDARVRKIGLRVANHVLTAEFERMTLGAAPDTSVQRLAFFAPRLLSASTTEEQQHLAAFLGSSLQGEPFEGDASGFSSAAETATTRGSEDTTHIGASPLSLFAYSDLASRAEVADAEGPDESTPSGEVAVTDVKSGATDEHIILLRTRLSQAQQSAALGDPQRALTLYEDALSEVLRLFGSGHPDTIMIRHLIAKSSGETGDAARARDLYEALIPDVDRQYGPHHPYPLVFRDYLGYWTGKAGDPTGAWDVYQRLIPAMERVHGPEHLDTLNMRHEAASWVGKAGNASLARDLFEDLLADTLRILGPDHPATLTRRHKLALWVGQAGDAAKARSMYEHMLPHMVGVLGPDHSETLAARNNHAYFVGASNDALQARELFEALVDDMERVYGPANNKTRAAQDLLDHWNAIAGGANDDA
jgi:hypothetical protein